jgi:Outer membrane protein beta-barrel domain
MRMISLLGGRGRRIAVATLCLALATIASPQIHAQDDLLGLYGGGSVGQSRVEADAPQYTAYEFSEHHSAFKVMAGIRPISFIGAEIEYLDLGHPSTTLGGYEADASVKGGAAYGVLYLPMGVPLLDLFGKAGVARIETTFNGASTPYGCFTCIAPLFHFSRTDTNVAAGVGVQYRLGPVAIRGEYERFDTSDFNPTLLSLGLTWTFL